MTSVECVGYLAGRDDARPADAVQRHLDECERCRVLMAETARATFADGQPQAAATPVRALADGEEVGGRYQIRRFIARGGMGEVYEAFDAVLGEPVALKTLAPTALDVSDAAGRLVGEVRLARKVVHPNVSRILELGVHRRRGAGVEAIPFLTMDLLDGETLASRLRREGALDPARALRILRELAAGLATVHAAGIVHHDFKSENVFLVRGAGGGAAERAVVMDFGLARAAEANRAGGTRGSGSLAGTVAYMAPEQIEGARPSPAFDVYALGVVAFEVLTGQLPFAGPSPQEVVRQRLQQAPPRPSSRRPGALSPAWDDLVCRCLARDPADRPRSIAAVAAALERLGAGAGARRRARRPLALALAGAGALAVAAATFGTSRPAPPVAAPAPAAAPAPVAAAPAPRATATPAPSGAIATAAPATGAPARKARPARPRPRAAAPAAAETATAPPARADEAADDFIDPFAGLARPRGGGATSPP